MSLALTKWLLLSLRRRYQDLIIIVCGRAKSLECDFEQLLLAIDGLRLDAAQRLSLLEAFSHMPEASRPDFIVFLRRSSLRLLEG